MTSDTHTDLASMLEDEFFLTRAAAWIREGMPGNALASADLPTTALETVRRLQSQTDAPPCLACGNCDEL